MKGRVRPARWRRRFAASFRRVSRSTIAEPRSLRGLVWVDVDLDAARVAVTRQLDHLARGERVPLKGKGAAERRTVPLTPDLVASLRDHRARQSEHGRGGPGDWVFTLANGGPIPADRFGSAFQSAARAAGLGPDPNLVPHSLRHGYGSHLIRAGVDVVIVSKRMGHASVDITLRVYAHEVEERRAAADAEVVAAMAAMAAEEVAV